MKSKSSQPTLQQITMSSEEREKTRIFMQAYLSDIDHLRLTDDYMCGSHEQWMRDRGIIVDVIERMILRVGNFRSHEDLLEEMLEGRNFNLINGDES